MPTEKGAVWDGGRWWIIIGIIIIPLFAPGIFVLDK